MRLEYLFFAIGGLSGKPYRCTKDLLTFWWGKHILEERGYRVASHPVMIPLNGFHLVVAPDQMELPPRFVLL